MQAAVLNAMARFASHSGSARGAALVALTVFMVLATLAILLAPIVLLDPGGATSTASGEAAVGASDNRKQGVFSASSLPSASATAGVSATPASTRTTQSPVLVGTGDIADCQSNGDEATAMLLDGIDGTVFTLGDNVYPSGTPAQFDRCYTPSWGRHRDRTRPSLGDSEYRTPGAAGYFQYFGELAGVAPLGYYSYELAGWHIVVANSMCQQVGGCGAGSPQEQWLRADLAAHPTACTLAYWHHPRFSSVGQGRHDPEYEPFWRALHEAGAEIVVSAHDHVYERFAPQTPAGEPDAQRGIRQFTVGTGGKNLYEFGEPVPTSEVRNNDTFGVLKLTLHRGAYDWEFIAQQGRSFTDSGSGTCH